MDKGLTEFTTFFFFISPNSLASKMVTLEWQTALNRAINGDLKFVVKSENNYKTLEEVLNIQVSVQIISRIEVRLTIKAVLYAENNPVFAFTCSNSFDEYSACFTISNGMVTSGSDVITTQVGCVLNASTVQLHRPLKPGFPFVFEVTLKNNAKHFNDVTVFKLIDAEKRIYQYIPLSNIELLENTVK